MRASEFIVENIELRHKPTETGGVEIHAYRNGQELGWVRFRQLKTGQLKAAMVHVPERFRRQGVGTAMYQYARNELGLDVVPSDAQTELGKAFWNKQQAQDQQLAERKKRRKRSRGAYSGPGGWYGYYYGHSGEGEAGGDAGGGESVRTDMAEDLTEIENMPAKQFVGGKDMLYNRKRPAKRDLQPLPGGTDLLYAVDQDRHGPRVVMVDPGVSTGTKPQVVAALYLATVDYLPNTVQVISITVNEDYRGRGLAKTLYDIVLTKMQKNLLSGDAQTPGGKRNWMSLASIPGVVVKGMVRIPNDIFNGNKTHTPSLPVQKYYDRTMDQIMELGGQFFYNNKNNDSSYWLFDVVPGKGQLQPYVQNSLSKLYGFDASNLLLAIGNQGINEGQPGVAEGEVEDLEQDLKHPHSYDAIDHMMQTIARDNKITAKQLHDRFVEKHDMTPDEWIKERVDENFADGKNPGRKGLAKRTGVNCKQSVTKLRTIAKNSSGERQRMAHWCANMKAGRQK